MTPRGKEYAPVVTSASMPVSELIARCVAGEDAAQAIFVGEYGPVVRRAVLRKLRGLANAAPVRSDADDLCHEVFERLLEHGCRRLAELRQPESIVYWLTSVAQRQVISTVRRWTSRSKLYEAALREPPTAPEFRPDLAAIANENAEHVRSGLERLPASERLVLELYYLQGLQYSEIAQITGRKIGVISSQIHRAKRKLRKLLECSADSSIYGTGTRVNR